MRHMFTTELLHEDSGVLGMGPEGDRRFAGKAFMDVLSVFTTAPLFGVYHGERELGSLDPISFMVKGRDDPIVLLGGRSWRVIEIDWKRMRAIVEPTALDGKSRWVSDGPPLSFQVCRAMREVLTGEPVAATVSRRATERLSDLREEFAWVDSESTVLLRDGTCMRWFTFAGVRANATLAELFAELREDPSSVSNLALSLRGDVTEADFRSVMRRAQSLTVFPVPVPDGAIDGLKFSECLPREVGRHELSERLRDDDAARACLAEPVRFVILAEEQDPRWIR